MKENIILVNYNHPFYPQEEVVLLPLGNKQFISVDAYKPLKTMLEKMNSLNLKPIICSSYRSIEKQKELYQHKCQFYLAKGYDINKARILASYWVARPHHSEHHTGLAVDLVASNNLKLDQSQVQTAENQWLQAHCWQYGFILRYPKDKEEITHVHYEPWHFRYVGKKVAKIIFEKQITLEEYLVSLV